MKKYEDKSIRKGCTETGKIPDSVGFPKGGGGFIRKLTKKEHKTQTKYGQI